VEGIEGEGEGHSPAACTTRPGNTSKYYEMQLEPKLTILPIQIQRITL